MPAFLTHSSDNARSLPITLFVTTVLANLGTSSRHSLLTNAVAWIIICTYSSLKLRRSGKGFLESAPSAWTAGALLASGHVCERAVDLRGIWWSCVSSMRAPTTVKLFIEGILTWRDTTGSSSIVIILPPSNRTTRTPRYDSRVTCGRLR